ncbi:MAG: amino acid ABC transporter substrate-binding protein [Rhodospirillales bacterium]
MRRLLAAAAAAALLISAPAFADPSPTLDKIGSSGEILLGYRDAAPPFSSVDPATGIPSGYSIDLCLKIADAIRTKLNRPDLKVRYVPVTAENRFHKVVDGSVDLECGTSTITLARQETVDFTNMIFITGGALLVPAKEATKGMADLAGKKIGVVTGTTTEADLKAGKAAGAIDVTVEGYDGYEEALKALEKGKIAAIAGDQLILIGLVRGAADPAKFALATELFSYEPYGIALVRNDADFRLVANRVLADLYRSGNIQAVYQKWFGDWGGRPSALLVAMFALNGIPEGTPE